jgi:hypothetical protein
MRRSVVVSEGMRIIEWLRLKLDVRPKPEDVSAAADAMLVHSQRTGSELTEYPPGTWTVDGDREFGPGVHIIRGTINVTSPSVIKGAGVGETRIVR